MSSDKQKPNQPAHTVRAGALKLTIWQNTNDKGAVWYSINPSRSYKQDDGSWKETSNLGQDDLLPMAELHREAWAWIAKQIQADAKARRDREAEPAAA
jgi:hypothetical protein